jgi:hypothetical protein
MIYIKELLPNPVGRDTEGEWVKLINIGDAPVNIHGWRLKDASGKTFLLGAVDINPGGEVNLGYSETKIPLNNDGDEITLIDSDGNTVDTLTYTGHISDDEIVIADRFIPQVEGADVSAKRPEELAFAGGGIDADIGATPLLAAFTVAIAASVVIGLLTKRSYEK